MYINGYITFSLDAVVVCRCVSFTDVLPNMGCEHFL
jgi:hypothetical protein